MLFALALIPAIALLIFIYFKDKKEKEPMGLLIGLFFAGMGTIITAVIAELIGQVILEIIMPYDSVIKAAIMAFIIVAPAEELGKYLVLRLITWKNKAFDYLFDGIVYAVFVSLGFAAFENVGYVLQNGLATGILRMFTAVPGHTVFAVFMGYFYSKSKHQAILGNKAKAAMFNMWAILAPILIHGAYDAVLMMGEASYDDTFQVICVLGWIGLLVAMYVTSLIIVHKTSKNDFYICILPDNTQAVYRPAMLGSWTCGCGHVSTGNFCPECGAQRPVVTSWFCTSCGTKSHWNFCGNCGAPKPVLRRDEPVAPAVATAAPVAPAPSIDTPNTTPLL